MRESQLKGRLRLAMLQERTEARGEEMAIEAERFHRLAQEDQAPRVVSSFNLFQTPAQLAADAARMLPHVGRTLEPSAGLGRLYRAIRGRSSDCPVVLVEMSADCCRELYQATAGDPGAELVQADFLACGVDRLGQFDSVLMNPPFKMGTDVKHIRHALSLLVTGGTLVSFCAAGPKQRRFAEEIGAEWFDLPAGSFRSEGTGVDAAIIRVGK